MGCCLGLLWPNVALAAADGALTLWLRGDYRERQGEQQSWSALLGVTIAFDRLYVPTIETPLSTGIAEPPPPPRVPLAPVAPSGTVQPGTTPPSTVQPAPVPDADQRPSIRLSAAFVQAAIRAALRAQQANERDEQLDSLRSRSRSSAALPELRLGAGRSTDQSVRLSPTTDDPYRYTQAGGADLWLEARVSWQLDRLLFAREELTIERLRDAHYQAKAKRARAVVDALFAWQKALLEAQDPERSVQEQLLAQLRAAHQAAVVDALTGGWFSEKYELWPLPEPAASPQR
ncbi:MAG TPA: hypothetical protein VHO25_07080 [Polyangiaceae bacterium]|nr:hypothetical protein [Polyangiaceae bacterium]